jgi:hypothetical protein
MPKTGTSHIQNFLWANDKALRKYGYVFPHFASFPSIGKARNGYFLRNQLKDPETGKRNVQREEEIYTNNFNKISELAEEYDNIILSEEGIWNTPKFSFPKYMEEIKTRGLETKIVVYLRRQDLFIQSYWAQKVKETSTTTFSKYIESKKYNKLKFDYYDRLNEIEGFVGKENMIVRVYEKGQFKNNDLTDDFLDAVGLEMNDDFVVEDRIYNPSLNGIYLEVKRLLNYNPEFKIAKSYVVPLIYKVMADNSAVGSFNSSQYFSADEQAEFLAQYSEGNSLVAKEYLNRADGRLFYDKIDNSNEEAIKYSTQELVDVCGQIINVQRNEYELLIADLKETVASQKAVIKQQDSTIKWVTTSFPKKVTRKLKRIFKIKKSSK